MRYVFSFMAFMLSFVNLYLLLTRQVYQPALTLFYVVCCFLASWAVLKNKDISYDSLNVVLGLFSVAFSSILFLFILST